jgi:DNA-binding protein HU-beta
VKTGSNGSEKFWGEVNGMNKSELINKVAETSELSKKDATKAVDAVFDAISEALQGGDKVQLVGFGNFEVRERSARKGRNPQTGGEIDIPASKIPAFKPGKALKDGIQ